MKYGDRIKVTHTGTVQVADGGGWFTVENPGGAWNKFRYDDPSTTYEILPKPEPKWKLGHVVIDKYGIPFVFDGGHYWVAIRSGNMMDDDAMRRPLTRYYPVEDS